MKKSTILLVSALVFFLCSLTAFNFAMKAEYETGNYKDPFHGFVAQDFTGFAAVEVNGSSLITVKIVQGPYKVLLHKRVQDFVQVKQQENKLVVEVNLKEKRSWSNGRHVVYISCPRLTELTTTAQYTLAGKPQFDSSDDNPYVSQVVQVENFEQDSLRIVQDHASAVKLNKTKLDNLQGIVGISAGSGSKLIIGKENQISSAALDIRNKSTLFLHDVVIPAISYQFSDSARADFTGASLQLISKK